MEPIEVYIGRQPILDREMKISGFELLFRNGQADRADVEDNVRATANVMINTLSNMGIRNVVGESRAFINVDDAILLSGVIDLLPKEKTVLEILETVEITGPFIDLCARLKKEGYHFALDDFVYREAAMPLFHIVDYVKVDVLLSDIEAVKDTVHMAKEHRVGLLAEKVETREDFKTFRDLGFGLFQGYFFARPAVLTAKSIPPALMVLMELLRLVSQEADLYLIEDLFRKNPGLNLKLLKLLNSASFYLNKVKSIKQAISFLGYRKLQKWVTLLLFAGAGEDIQTNPLLERAAVRGRMAEVLAGRLHSDEATSDSAFMTGVLSLADTLLQIPMTTAVKELNLSSEIEDALTTKRGLLGSLVEMLEGLESGGPSAVAGLLDKRGLNLEDLFVAEETAVVEYERYLEDR